LQLNYNISQKGPSPMLINSC